MTKTIVVDSDAIFALYNPNDSLNQQATSTFKQLLSKEYQLVYPISVLFEVVTLFQRVLPTPAVTSELIEIIKNERILMQPIDNALLKEAALIFDPKGSKKNTLIDCSVVAITKRLKADGVFSYDNFYNKQGLKSAEEVLK